MNHDWIVCVSAEDTDNQSTYILENVTRYEIEGHFASLMKNPVFIEYGISPSKEGAEFPYRIHDSLMTPVKNGKILTDLVDALSKIFRLIEHSKFPLMIGNYIKSKLPLNEVHNLAKF